MTDVDFAVQALDSYNLIARRVAAVGESEIVLTDSRMANHRQLFVNVMVYPAPNAGNQGTEVPFLWFNLDRSAAYEGMHRAYVNTADSPPSTEEATSWHHTNAPRLRLVPGGSSAFVLAAGEVFTSWMFLEQQDAVEQYRIHEWWAIGESVSGGTNKHPRYGHLAGQYIGSVAGKKISTIGLVLAPWGRMGQGSELSVYGLRTPLLDGSFDYNDQKSASTTGMWAPTSKAMFRRVMKVSPLPIPGSTQPFSLADTSFNIGTMNIAEVWIVDESEGISEAPSQGIAFSISGTMLNVASASGGKDWSGYDYAYVVLTWARP